MASDEPYKARTTLLFHINTQFLNIISYGCSGASCLFELKEGVCAAVRDVLEHPSSWGLDLESGASLPPMSAFYHVTLQPSIQILNRLPTLQGLRELLDLIMRVGSLDTTDSQLEDSSSIELANRSMNFTEKDLYSPDSLWYVCKTLCNLE